MTAAVRASARGGPEALSLAGLVLAGLGVAAATWLVVGGDGDPTHVRWWLVVAPIAFALLPVVVPVSAARIGATVALGAWCVLASASIGFLLLPALAALVGAVVREGR